MKKKLYPRLVSVFFIAGFIFSAYVNAENELSRSATMKGSNPKKADYVIIGNGTAGAIIARFLSDPVNNHFVNSVVVLEAGQNLSADPSVLQGAPFGDSIVEKDPKYAKTSFANIANLNPGLVGFPYTEGRMWGGSSAHNGEFCVRDTPYRCDAIAAIAGNAIWSYNNLLPLMKFLENYTPNGTVANPAQRGVNGPLNIIQDPPLANLIMNALSSATNSPLVTDINDPSQGQVGVGVHQWWASTAGVRSFSSGAFLPASIVDQNTGKGLGGRKLTIVSGATVTRILFKNTSDRPKAYAVEYILDGIEQEVLIAKGKKKIILCAGVIQSPAILQRSGVGSATLLNSLNIPVVADNANVGANLQNHYSTAALIGLDVAHPFPFQIINVYSDLSGANLPPADHIRRNQMYVVIGNAFFPAAPLVALGLQNTPAITLLPTNIIPNSRGSVQIVSANPLTEPRVSFNFYSDTVAPTDLDLAVNSYKMVANIAAAYGQPVLYPPMSHYPAPYGPAPDDSLLRQDAINVNTVAYHAAGTCKMSSSAVDGVVDGTLHVYGVDNLMVADDSTVPLVPDANTAYRAYLTGCVASKILGVVLP